MTSVDEIVAMARSVRERANDLRALEVLALSPMAVSAEDVSAYGDTGTSFWTSTREGFPAKNFTLDEYLGQNVDTSRYGSEFDYIPELFERLAFGDAADYLSVLDQLRAVDQALGPGAGEFIEHPDIVKIGSLNEGWTGSFPNAFRDHFAAKLPYHIPYQKYLIQELAAAVKGHWNLVEATRESLLNILTATEEVLANTIRIKFGHYMGEGGTPLDPNKAASLALCIVGAVLAIAAFPVSIPAGTAAVTLAIGNAVKAVGDATVMSIGGIEKPDGITRTNFAVEGSDVDAILSAMHDSLAKLQLEIADEEQRQADHLKDSINALNQQLANTRVTDDESHLFVPFRLAVADDTPIPNTDQFDHAE